MFAESFDLDTTEAVCGFGEIGPIDIAGLLGSLVDKSLVVAEPTGPALRYRLLETIRQFAAERLSEAVDGEADAVAAAHCAHFLSVAETAAPHLTRLDQGKWLARLDADQADLRRAAHAVGEVDRTEQVLRFGAALKRYWMSRSRNEEALALLLPVLDRPEACADPELFGRALLTAAGGISGLLGSSPRTVAFAQDDLPTVFGGEPFRPLTWPPAARPTPRRPRPARPPTSPNDWAASRCWTAREPPDPSGRAPRPPDDGTGQSSASASRALLHRPPVPLTVSSTASSSAPRYRAC